jgi:hypothetical protein
MAGAMPEQEPDGILQLNVLHLLGTSRHAGYAAFQGA